MFKNVLSYKGRIRRTEYCLTYLAYIIITYFLDIFTLYTHREYPYFKNIIILIPLLWIILAQGVKRCHDRGNSGWYQLIPFYVFWMIFADGDHGPNKYGDNPKGIGNYEDINEIGKQIENE